MPAYNRGMAARKLAFTFEDFFKSEKAGGFLLLVCSVVSVVVANSGSGTQYIAFWQTRAAGLSIEHWINDGLMAVFFLLVGLELKRELLVGELSSLKTALLPVIAALGGVVVPAAIHLSLNADLPTRAGVGIPIATDIAFALGVLSILGRSVPGSLKIFLAALAVIDDLVAILVIAVFYTADLSIGYLGGALGVFGILVFMNRQGVGSLAPYLLGGALMWFLMLHSGVHATIAGVLLALAMPHARKDARPSASLRLEHVLHKPVAFLVLPVFAIANTALPLSAQWLADIGSPNSTGIIAGLLVGKPVGITLFTLAAVTLGLCRLPRQMRWAHVVGLGFLGGIGFTMSIFITNLAFPGDAALVDGSKIAIFIASISAGVVGLAWLKWFGKAPDGPS